MKKGSLILIFSLLLMGCSVGKEKLEFYVDNPNMLIEDPHFKGYEESLNQLESEYLSKKITYAEYLKKKKELDDQYDKEVQQRNEHVLPQQ